MAISEYLLKAIESGEVLNIIYHGGSKPGGIRTIIPRSTEGDALKAVDTEQNRVKSFSISKIEILDKNNEIIKFDIDEKQTKKESISITIEKIYEAFKETLEGFGWNVSFEEGVNEKGSHLKFICLYDSYKNGKPKSKPSVIFYTSTSKSRPCGVGSLRMETRTFKSLDNAFKLFLEEAQNCEIKNPIID